MREDMPYLQCAKVQLPWAIAFSVFSCFSKSAKAIAVFCLLGCLWTQGFLLPEANERFVVDLEGGDLAQKV